jgi:hypothetical protein
MTTPPCPADTAPLDPEEFINAYLYAGMVVENEFLEQVPEIDTASVIIDDCTYKLSRHPMNLFGLAVMRHFHGEPDKAHAFLWRFLGFQRLLDHGPMNVYITGSSERPQIHPAVLEVAATQKLSENYQFEPELFFRNVRDVAARMGTEEVTALKRSRDADKNSSTKRKHTSDD